MGNESSQLKNEAAEEPQDVGRVIGPPMSPTPPPYPGEQRGATATVRAPISPLGSEAAAADDLDARSSSVSNPSKPIKKKKKKKSKRRNSLDSEAADDQLAATTAGMADDDPAPALDSPKKRKGKKKSHKKKSHGAQSPDTNLLVSHTNGGSPPSGQQTAADGIAGHTPTPDTESVAQTLIPASSEGSFDMGPLKAHRDVPDHELPFLIADESMVNGDHLQQSPFMHKREMSIVDAISDLESNDEASLPDLQPSQVKPEPPSSESESDLGSPSVARLERLERSRSRSISRPPPTKPANGSVSFYMHPV